MSAHTTHARTHTHHTNTNTQTLHAHTTLKHTHSTARTTLDNTHDRRYTRKQANTHTRQQHVQSAGERDLLLPHGRGARVAKLAAAAGDRLLLCDGHGERGGGADDAPHIHDDQVVGGTTGGPVRRVSKSDVVVVVNSG